jgi:CRP/FNR family cyclic AMP-dependent transcriptional regulator
MELARTRPLFPGSKPGLLPDEEANLHRNRWFGSLPESLRREILARCDVRRLPPGQMLARRGDEAIEWYGVAAGALSLCSQLPDGRSFRLNVIGPGRWWGDIGLLDGKPQDLDIQTQTQCTLLVLHRAPLQELLAASPLLREAALQLQCERLRHLFRRVEELLALPLPQRVARQLARLAREFGRPVEAGVCIDLNLSQSDLAAMLGASRQRTNTCLQQLQRLGVIEVVAPRITLLDAARLRALSEGRASA